MIRNATIEDLPALVAIYNEAIAERFATGDTEPVTANSRRSWFVEHEPTRYPIYVWADGTEVKGWCSLSPYRPGRAALRFTAEISYYVRSDNRRKGIASALVLHSMQACLSLGIKNLIAIVLERNLASCGLLQKFGFERWGLLPRVADFGGEECGHIYFGRRVEAVVWPSGAPPFA